MNKNIKIIVQVALTLVIIVLAYMVYSSIMKPVKFNKEKDQREEIVIQRLKDIRTAQVQYRNMYEYYNPSLDSLVNFVMYGKLPIIKLLADPTDTTFTKHIKDTIGYATVKDTLFGGREGFDAAKLKFIPFSEGEMFQMTVDTIDRGGVMVNVIEVFAPKEAYLKGMDAKMIEKLAIDGRRFGSMTQPTTDGNWE